MEGFLLIDKPVGLTSHDVIDRIRKITGIRKVGHAGTLDPFASGLLFIAIGPYTKKLQRFVGLSKTYAARMHLGATSETYDPEGPIMESIHEKPERFDQSTIEQALEKFRGGYLQKAPLFSAKKVQGKRLYELARKGQADLSMRPEKQVDISHLQLLSFDWPYADILVSCGSGTYIRSLVHDIGEALGTGAYAEMLRRTQIGEFSVADALPLDDLTREKVAQALMLDTVSND